MSTLLLKISEGCEEPYVEFHIDGEDLGAIVKAALGEAGFDDVLPWWHGGDYKIDHTVLGQEVRRNGAEEAILFACGCGYYACSGVSAKVVVSGDELMIRDISTSHRGKRVVASLPPLVFNRAQFDEAVRQLERAVEKWKPSVKPGGAPT